MKKIMSCIFALLVFASVFSTVAFAATDDSYELYKTGSFSIRIPEELLADKQWAEANGYLNSWKTEDEKFEIMVNDYKYYGKFGPLTGDESRDCRRFDEKDSGMFVSYTGGCDGEVNVGELTATKYIQAGDLTDGLKFSYTRYEFTDGDENFVVSFFVHDEQYSPYVQQILNTVVMNTTPGFLKWENVSVFLICFFSAMVIITISDKKRRAKK